MKSADVCNLFDESKNEYRVLIPEVLSEESKNHVVVLNFNEIVEDILRKLDEYTELLKQKQTRMNHTCLIRLRKRMQLDLMNDIRNYSQQIELMIYDFQKMIRGYNDVPLEVFEYIQITRSNISSFLNFKFREFIYEK